MRLCVYVCVCVSAAAAVSTVCHRALNGAVQEGLCTVYTTLMFTCVSNLIKIHTAYNRTYLMTYFCGEHALGACAVYDGIAVHIGERDVMMTFGSHTDIKKLLLLNAFDFCLLLVAVIQIQCHFVSRSTLSLSL